MTRQSKPWELAEEQSYRYSATSLAGLAEALADDADVLIPTLAWSNVDGAFRDHC